MSTRNHDWTAMTASEILADVDAALCGVPSDNSVGLLNVPDARRITHRPAMLGYVYGTIEYQPTIGSVDVKLTPEPSEHPWVDKLTRKLDEIGRSKAEPSLAYLEDWRYRDPDFFNPDAWRRAAMTLRTWRKLRVMQRRNRQRARRIARRITRHHA